VEQCFVASLEMEGEDCVGEACYHERLHAVCCMDAHGRRGPPLVERRV
jgi:hypothetical protein